MAHDTRKARILVVDDEPDITSVFKKVLTEEGYEVDTFDDPEKALSNFKADIYDLLLLDIRMPKMNGFDLYRKMCKIDEKPRPCFITAFEIYEEEFKKIFPDSKVKCFIKKPVSRDNLIAQIRAEIARAETR